MNNKKEMVKEEKITLSEAISSLVVVIIGFVVSVGFCIW